jgi:conjugal transfer ATP-binding protein TraC
MVKRILKFLSGDREVYEEEKREARPLERSELRKMVYRNSFSRYLPWIAYDEKEKLFYNVDNTIGVMWECLPGLFFSEKDMQVLEGLFKIGYPEGSVMQFILMADSYIDPLIRTYLERKKYAPSFVLKAMENLAKYYKDSKALDRLPSRWFRLFVTLKVPENEFLRISFPDICVSVEEILRAVGLFPRRVDAGSLLALMRRYFDIYDEDVYEYCLYTEIRKQILTPDVKIQVEDKHIKTGENYWRCLTPKSLPAQLDIFWSGFLTGSYEGVSGDVSQINSPFFMMVWNILFRDLKAKITTKANVVITQQSLGTFVAALARRKEEFMKVFADMEEGTRYYEVIPILWVKGKNKDEVREAVFRAKRLWESTGAVMQEEEILLMPLFIYSLPFGFYWDNKTLEFLDRTFILPSHTLPYTLPIQTDYFGTGSYALLFKGRKGQVIGFDFFTKGASNYNWYVAAPTGKGKSFLVNYIVYNYYAEGVKVRIIDIGGSYKKLVHMLGGKFIDFEPNSNISLNPFAQVREPEYDLPVVTTVILQMIKSQTGTLPTEKVETVTNIIRSAVNYAYKEFGNEASIDDVYRYLIEFPKYSEEYEDLCADGKEVCLDDFKLITSHLVFNLKKFTSDGVYGKWFTGKSNIDFSEDRLVVLELEALKPQRDLYSVVVLQVLNMATMDLYLSDRMSPRLVIFDEAWQFLQDNELYQKIIEEGYRRARKYGGSFGIITQSFLDLEQFGGVGKVINANCEFKFFLESGDFPAAKKRGIIDYDDFTMHILNTLKYNAPKYSEVFIHSDTFGCGIVRLVVDRYSYYLFTTKPDEVAEIERMVREEGLPYEEAIQRMVEREKGR